MTKGLRWWSIVIVFSAMIYGILLAAVYGAAVFFFGSGCLCT